MPKLSENAYKIAEKRYFYTEEGEDSWEKLSTRVSIAIASRERDRNKWADIFSEEIYDMNFIPGGRILRNAGRRIQSMMNCICLPILDSIEEIGECIKNSLVCWSYGAGIGVDFTPLRHKGAELKSKGGNSSGMTSFMKSIDSVAHTIETGGQRRSGMLAMCRVNHPEIEEFIDAKLVDGDLSYFNISVAVDSSFLKAVELDGDWDLTFDGRVVKTVKARYIWNKILEGMIRNGEPGLINYENLIKNNSYYFQRISATNLCSELPLPAFGSCCLGSLVLTNFLNGKNTNWKKLQDSIYKAIRFLDNVIDVNFYPLEQIKRVSLDSRRIGLGVMGLHDYLMTKEIKYGSEKAINEIEKLFKFIRDMSYIASWELAKEKGNFPGYIKSEYLRASFIKKLPPKIRMMIKDNGIRNTCIISGQPTGTTSLIPEVSSSIEPNFALAYKRNDRVSSRMYIHPQLKEVLSNEDIIPDYFVDASDISPSDHFEVQCAIQKYIDNATSKTINCPEGTSVEELSDLLLEYINHVKGVTAYVDKTRKEQVLNRLTMGEAKKYLKESTQSADTETVTCAKGTCEI